jgi:hypothetical protein
MIPGAKSACWKSSIPFLQKIGRGVSKVLRTCGPQVPGPGSKKNTVFQTQDDVDRAVREFPVRVEQEVFNHYLKTRNSDGELSPCTHCTHGSEHVPKKGSCCTCLGQISQIKAHFAEKFKPKTLRKIFVVGQKANQNNIAESFQNICRMWVGKHVDASATEYFMGMMAATLHGNERYEFGLNPDLPVWYEKLFANAAERNGVSPGAMTDAKHMMARRAAVRSATAQAKRRKSTEGRALIQQSVKKRKLNKIEESAKTAKHYKPVRAKTAEDGQWSPGARTPKPGAESETSKNTSSCRCGNGDSTTPPHKRVSSLQCLLNPKSKNFVPMADVIAVAEGAIIEDDGVDELGVLDTEAILCEMGDGDDDEDDEDDEDDDDDSDHE